MPELVLSPVSETFPKKLWTRWRQDTSLKWKSCLHTIYARWDREANCICLQNSQCQQEKLAIHGLKWSLSLVFDEKVFSQLFVRLYSDPMKAFNLWDFNTELAILLTAYRYQVRPRSMPIQIGYIKCNHRLKLLTRYWGVQLGSVGPSSCHGHPYEASYHYWSYFEMSFLFPNRREATEDWWGT